MFKTILSEKSNIPYPTFLILSSDCCYEEQALRSEAEKKGFKAFFIGLNEIDFELETQAKIIWQDQDLLKLIDKKSVICIRRSRGNFEKMLTVLNIFETRKIRYSDSFRGVTANLDKSICLPGFESKIIPNILPTYFVSKENLENFDFKNIIFPCITKPVSGRHGEGFMKHNDLKSLKKFLMNLKYRIFVIGNKSYGAVKKIKAKNTLIANAHAGAVFQKVSLAQKFHKEAVSLCKKSGIEIGGIDFVQTKDGKYFSLEINRCPEFQVFEKATNQNIAKEIIDFLCR